MLNFLVPSNTYSTSLIELSTVPVQKLGHEKQQFTRPIDDEVLKRDERMNSSILLFVSIGNNARVSVSLRLYSLGLYDRVFVVKEKKKKNGI